MSVCSSLTRLGIVSLCRACLVLQLYDGLPLWTWSVRVSGARAGVLVTSGEGVHVQHVSYSGDPVGAPTDSHQRTQRRALAVARHQRTAARAYQRPRVAPLSAVSTHILFRLYVAQV